MSTCGERRKKELCEMLRICGRPIQIRNSGGVIQVFMPAMSFCSAWSGLLEGGIINTRSMVKGAFWGRSSISMRRPPISISQ